MLDGLSSLGSLFSGGTKQTTQSSQATSVSNNLALTLGEGNSNDLSPNNNLDLTPVQTAKDDYSLALSGTGTSQYKQDGSSTAVAKEPIATAMQNFNLSSLIYLGVGILIASIFGLIFKKSK